MICGIMHIGPSVWAELPLLCCLPFSRDFSGPSPAHDVLYVTVPDTAAMCVLAPVSEAETLMSLGTHTWPQSPSLCWRRGCAKELCFEHRDLDRVMGDPMWCYSSLNNPLGKCTDREMCSDVFWG